MIGVIEIVDKKTGIIYNFDMPNFSRTLAANKKFAMEQEKKEPKKIERKRRVKKIKALKEKVKILTQKVKVLTQENHKFKGISIFCPYCGLEIERKT